MKALETQERDTQLQERLQSLGVRKYVSYDPEIHPQLARNLCENYGFTDEELAQAIGISRRTLFRWKQKFPEFDEALSQGKAMCDAEVENALFREACGYEIEETVVTEDGKIFKKPVWLRGNTSAARWWLERRQPDVYGKAVMEAEAMGDQQKELGGILAAMMERMRDNAVARRKLEAIPVEAVEVTPEPDKA